MQLRVLSETELGRIHEATLKVLAKTGVGFKDSPQAQEIIKTAGCRAENERVYLPHDVIAQGLAHIPDRNSLDYYNHYLAFTGPITLKQGDVSFGLIGNAFTIHTSMVASARGGYRRGRCATASTRSSSPTTATSTMVRKTHSTGTTMGIA